MEYGENFRGRVQNRCAWIIPRNRISNVGQVPRTKTLRERTGLLNGGCRPPRQTFTLRSSALAAHCPGFGRCRSEATNQSWTRSPSSRLSAARILASVPTK